MDAKWLREIHSEARKWKHGEDHKRIIAEDVLTLIYEIRELRHLLRDLFGQDIEVT